MPDVNQHFQRQLAHALGMPEEYASFVTTARAAIEAVAGRESAYARTAEMFVQKDSGAPDSMGGHLRGVLEALQAAVRGGFLQSARELLHAEVFADLMEMAGH